MKYKNKLSLLLSTVILASSVVNAYASPFSGLLRRMGSGLTDTTSSVVTVGDMNHMYKTGSTLDAKPYTFKEDGSDGDGIPTNNSNVYQNGKSGPIVMPWEQYYDGLTDLEKKEYVLVRDKLTINKKNPEGDPLKGVKFTVKYGYDNEDKIDSTTNDKGIAVLDFSKLSNGEYTVEEAEKTINGVTYKSKTIKVYKDDGTRFLGEVTGNQLGITYSNIAGKMGKSVISNINSSTSSEIYNQYKKELDSGGIWLKFYDGKAKKIYYISKKPIVYDVSWNKIKASGMIYGPDVVNKDGTKVDKTGKLDPNNELDGYKPKILTSSTTNTTYQPALLRGRSNYGEPLSKGEDSYYIWTQAKNSQWNRAIVAITSSYRGEKSSMEGNLITKTNGNKYTKDLNEPDLDLKYKTADYNWFGDLTLGARESFQYNGKNISSIGAEGQWDWTQEYNSNSYRAYRGYHTLGRGASYSYYNGAEYGGNVYGLRLVLYPLPNCYDQMCFEGEVTGNSLGITYDNIYNNMKEKGSSKKILPTELDSVTGAEEIKDLYQKELANGGIWLKFTDYKPEKPVTFYVSKKPIVNQISWNNIKSSGMVYGPDVINKDGSKVDKTGKLDPNNELYNYKPTILTSQKGITYQPALLRGRSDYGKPLSNSKGSYYDWTQAKNSQWNRAIVAITSSYRGEKSSMEGNLITKTNGNKYTDNLKEPNLDLKYKTSNYNWFGDLTLGASGSFQYNGKNISSVEGKGKWNWTQEYNSGSGRAIRGYHNLDRGAAYSNDNSASEDLGYFGLRLALYPLATDN